MFYKEGKTSLQHPLCMQVIESSSLSNKKKKSWTDESHYLQMSFDSQIIKQTLNILQLSAPQLQFIKRMVRLIYEKHFHNLKMCTYQSHIIMQLITAKDENSLQEINTTPTQNVSLISNITSRMIANGNISMRSKWMQLKCYNLARLEG